MFRHLRQIGVLSISVCDTGHRYIFLLKLRRILNVRLKPVFPGAIQLWVDHEFSIFAIINRLSE